MTTKRVAVLGAGIMGTATAIFLARRNMHVTIFDEKPGAMCAASRWNEGKIHLGFLYSASNTLATAKQVLPGGLHFRRLLEELLGKDIGEMLTPTEDIFLCHKHSVVTDAKMERYFNEVAKLVKTHPESSRYCVDVSDCQVSRLSRDELMQLSGADDIVAGFHVPERSVATCAIADGLVDALYAEDLIETVFGQRVLSVSPASPKGNDDSWTVVTSAGDCGQYDYVINALWQGRLAIDSGLDMELPRHWSHRFRQSLFVRTREPVQHPNVVIATGPFGDIKNYNNRDFYLSWYAAGLRAQSNAIDPAEPLLEPGDDEAIAEQVFDALHALLPGTDSVRKHAESVTLAGGWVYAAADGSLADPMASVHARADFGIQKRGTYYSIDTGKYSTAPWLALQLANQIEPL